MWQFFNRVNPDATSPNKVIMQERHDRTQKLTYGGARTEAAQLAAGLYEILGLKPGDTVAVCGPNALPWAKLAYAGTWGGVVVAWVFQTSSVCHSI
jgi:acyl-coenzyme A synthetase/AMP-(fatty) acid ligase